MKTPQAHINQMVDEDNCLRIGSIEIKGRVSKNGKYFLAESAMEYMVEETETETVESEEVVDLEEALQEWIRPIGKVTLVDNAVPVYCKDKVFRPLVWKGKNGNVSCFNPGN